MMRTKRVNQIYRSERGFVQGALSVPLAILAAALVLSSVFYRAMLAVEGPDNKASVILSEHFNGCLMYDRRALGPVNGQILLAEESPGIRATAVFYEGGVPQIYTAAFLFNPLNQLVTFEGKRYSGDAAGAVLSAKGINPLVVTGSDGGRFSVPGPLMLFPVAGGRTFHYPALARRLLLREDDGLLRRFSLSADERCVGSADAVREARELIEISFQQVR